MGHLRSLKEEEEASYIIARKTYSRMLRQKHVQV